MVSFRRIESLSPELRRRWAAGRVWAAHEAPYLASALLALQPIVIERESEQQYDPIDLRAFPTDLAWHVYVDPAVLGRVEVGELGFWLLHQVTHLLRAHAERYPGERRPEGQQLAVRSADERRWNVAADAEIDDDLRTTNLTLPALAVHPAQLGFAEGLTAEQYWDLLPEHQRIQQRDSAPAPTTPQAGGAGCDCGTGCDGQERDWNCGRAGLSAVGVRLLARETARRIREHTSDRGDTPAGWERWADEVLEPTVNWRRQLAAHVRRGAADVAGRVDFTYRRPSRRASAVPDVILPSLRQPLPQVALVIDTSGSMSDQLLGQALGEVSGVLRSLGIARRNLSVIACDAQAYRSQKVRDLGAIRLEGGGGTDMGRGLEAAAALRPRPDLTIVLTDGYTPWPSAPPAGIRVVVGLMDRGGNTPDWADTVLVDAAGGRA